MNIMMNEYFTPMTGATGGSMIGLAAVVVLIFNGNILGASGILSHVVDAPHKALQDTSQFWRLVLLSTFLLTSTFLLGPQYATDDRIIRGDTSMPIPSELGYAVAGLLVGFGSKLGNGCTSGMYQGKAELLPIELKNHNELLPHNISSPFSQVMVCAVLVDEANVPLPLL
jgi:uncharacterized membrane protein YedE/YeeE